MGFNVTDTVEWSRFKWEMSWNKTAELEMLLPEIGSKYELSLVFGQRPYKDGDVFIVWKPPHSELNGWHDKRPSEILKSFLIEGTIKTLSQREKKYEFVVSNREKLVDVFGRLDESSVIPFHMPYSLEWQNAKQLKCAHVGGFIYLFGSYEEVWLEAILSRVDGALCLHYSSFRPASSEIDTYITKSYLDGNDRTILEAVLRKIKPVIDDSMDDLPETMVFGAEYY